jgi:hypothetical protein
MQHPPCSGWISSVEAAVANADTKKQLEYFLVEPVRWETLLGHERAQVGDRPKVPSRDLAVEAAPNNMRDVSIEMRFERSLP